MFKRLSVDGFIHSRKVFYHTPKFNANSLKPFGTSAFFDKAEMGFHPISERKIRWQLGLYWLSLLTDCDETYADSANQ